MLNGHRGVPPEPRPQNARAKAGVLAMNDPSRKDDLLNLPLAKAPDSIWTSIEAALDAGAEPMQVFRPMAGRWILMWGFAAATIVLVVAVLVWLSVRLPKTTWAVVRVDGKPSVGSKPMGDSGRIAVGEWLQTDASSRARIAVSDI